MVQAAIRSLVTIALAACPAAGWTAAPDPQDADVMYLPTPYPVVDAMLRLAGVHAGDRLFDLGAGDGRIVIAAAREYGVHAVGIELDPHKAAEARANVRRAGLDHLVEIRQGDVFTADLSRATVVTVFLFPEINERLEPKLREELAPGTRIVSHRFGLGRWPPQRRAEALGHPLLLWIVPAR
ncbi:MAG TPA: class I SAM-dependent methyltransferase [Burkholderiales bacterium]|nr:class I SAM-dependent methyltransferase [Burkholderiales bacterium]